VYASPHAPKPWATVVVTPAAKGSDGASASISLTIDAPCFAVCGPCAGVTASLSGAGEAQAARQQTVSSRISTRVFIGVSAR
jgi:hypothetical protein